MKLLRNKSFSTQILILYELYINHYTKLTPMAEKIGVTQQAISDYIKKMKKQGLVQKINGEYQPTIKGIHLLQTELLNFKNFIDEKIKKISLINDCVALAKTPIKTGENIALFMEDGWLVGYANKNSTSMGVATTDAKKGEYVFVGMLRGIIDHNVGKLYFLKLCLPSGSKSDKIEIDNIRKKVNSLKIDRVGILDVVAKSVCNEIGIKPDFEFGGIYAAIDATQRGLNTAILGHPDKIKDEIKKFEEINEKSSSKIDYEIL